MKNSFKYILMGIVLAGATLVSCDDLLETKNFSDMSPSNFFKTEGDMAAAVTGIYLPCTTNWGYSDGGTGNGITLFSMPISMRIIRQEWLQLMQSVIIPVIYSMNLQ